jgi:N-methylhydantoinase B/oxoprolinase/acetone carboxylase alpha subunit
MIRPDPVRLSIFNNLFSSIAEEMGNTLCRTAFSVNIKERRDFSCAVFDAQGKMISQAVHIPVHLGSMAFSISSVISGLRLEQGDMLILNDPFTGGTHLPDVTVISPVFIKKGLIFYVANRAHYADIGGITPGSMVVCTEIFQEGLIIPPTKICQRNRLNNQIFRVVLANVRNPKEVEGDLLAQIHSCKTGAKRLKELCERYPLSEVVFYAGSIQRYSRKMMEIAIQQIPDGVYECKDIVEGKEKALEIRLKLTIKGKRAICDFTGSARQSADNLNAVYPVTVSSVLYAFRCLIPQDIPANSGCLEPIRVIAPEGSILNARLPAAVAGGNVETSQRIVDVVFGALAKAIPERIPAASAGTMTNLSFGGQDPYRGTFAYYETVAGGMGARPGLHGVSGVHTNMTNTRNTPIEALEHIYPVRVIRYSFRRGSGGRGTYCGGEGLIREFEFLSPVQFSLLSDRHFKGPYGLYGGKAGAPGKAYHLIRGKLKPLPPKCTLLLQKGERVHIYTPGGGGWGRA